MMRVKKEIKNQNLDQHFNKVKKKYSSEKKTNISQKLNYNKVINGA